MNTELSNTELKKLAPSIFAKAPWEGVSKRYAFIPTIDVIDAMRDAGMVPVRASQSNARTADKRNFAKHMIRFRSREDLKKYPAVVDGNAHHFYKKGKEPEIVEVVLANAHDLSALYTLDAGWFRFICSNGLVVQSANFGCMSIRHVGNDTVKLVLETSKKIVDGLPLIQKQINTWRNMELTDAQRNTFAMAALIDRYGVDDDQNLLAPVTPETLLVHRRPEDTGKTLWTTMNVVQENMMRGEMIGASATGRKVHTREVKSVNTELSVNRNLWALTEAMAEGIGA